MKNADLEHFHKRIEKHILFAAARTKNANLHKIIKSCRLKPYSIFDGSFQINTVFERHWVDEFGNSLIFNATNSHIVINDLYIDKATQTTTDLFYGNSINTTSKNSKAALIAANDEECIVSFYGQDEYLRTFIFTHSAWEKISPLMLGIKTLSMLFDSINIAKINELDKALLDLIIPIKVDKCITMPLPSKQDISSCFTNKTLLKAILQEKINNG